MKALRFDVFGRRVLIAESNNGWVAFYLGDDGKRRSAPDIVVPADIPALEIAHTLMIYATNGLRSATPV